jgi:hypothetical protein
MIGKDFKRMRPNEISFCMNFIDENSHLNDELFAIKVNRLGLGGELASFKNKTLIWSMLINCIEPKVRKK